MSRRGIIYITWGDKPDRVHQRSIDSVARHHSELPIQVVRLPQTATLLEKSRMFDMTPFEETLYLDADTMARGRKIRPSAVDGATAAAGKIRSDNPVCRARFQETPCG